MRPKAAAGEQMITFDGVVALAGRDLCGDQANVADKMLRAGMMATGEMDVERCVDLDASLAPVADFRRVTLGIRGRELAAGVAGAGNQPCADLRGFDRKPRGLDGGDRRRDVAVVYAGDQQVLPHREAEIAIP